IEKVDHLKRPQMLLFVSKPSTFHEFPPYLPVQLVSPSSSNEKNLLEKRWLYYYKRGFEFERTSEANEWRRTWLLMLEPRRERRESNADTLPYAAMSLTRKRKTKTA